MGCVNGGGVGVGPSCGARGTYYHRLPGGRPPRGWAFVKRTMARTVGFYSRRRRWVARHMRRVRWASLWGKLRRAVGLAPPASRGGAGRHAAAGYDSVSYSQNFDDGRWREEEEYWRSGSFAYRFGQSGRYGNLLEGC